MGRQTVCRRGNNTGGEMSEVESGWKRVKLLVVDPI